MPKEVIVLGLEGSLLRAVRIAESGKDYRVMASETWETDVVAPASEEVSAPEAEAGEAVVEETGEDRFMDALHAAVSTFSANEFVLSMPLSKLLVEVIRLPVERRDELEEAANEAIERISPFPGETYRVGVEVVAETDREIVAMVSALPEAVSVELGDALEAAKVRVVRTDATALGRLRTLWPRIVKSPASRRLVLMNLDDGWDFIVLDDDAPVVLRGLGAVATAAELSREVMLGLIRCENSCGERELSEIVVVTAGSVPEAEYVSKLSGFGQVRTEVISEDDAYSGVLGVANRTVEGSSLDVTPFAWDQALKEARFKKRLTASLAVAGTIWALAMGALFGVPVYFGWQTDRVKAASKRQQRAYTEVRDMRDRVKLVQRYSDHARGALETLKLFSDLMPEGVLLTQFQYRRGESVRVSAEAPQANDAYEYKNAITRAEDERGERLFAEVTLSEVKQARGGGNRFDVEAKFPVEAEDSAPAAKKGGR